MFACSPHEDPIKDEADLKSRTVSLVAESIDHREMSGDINAPTVMGLANPPTPEPAPLTPAQQAAQDISDRQEYIAMLDDVIPMQRAELLSSIYIRAEMAKAGDVAIHKARALKAIAKTTGALSPFMERALLLIRAGKK